MTTRTSLLDLQKAIWTALTNNKELTNKVSCICDYVEENMQYPYIFMGEDEVIRQSTKDFFFEEITTPIQIFSSYKGKREVKELTDIVLKTLENIQLEGIWQITNIRLESIDILDEKEYKESNILIKFETEVRR